MVFLNPLSFILFSNAGIHRHHSSTQARLTLWRSPPTRRCRHTPPPPPSRSSNTRIQHNTSSTPRAPSPSSSTTPTRPRTQDSWRQHTPSRPSSNPPRRFRPSTPRRNSPSTRLPSPPSRQTLHACNNYRRRRRDRPRFTKGSSPRTESLSDYGHLIDKNTFISIY